MTNPRDVEEVADMLIEEEIANLVDFYLELVKSYQNSPTPELMREIERSGHELMYITGTDNLAWLRDPETDESYEDILLDIEQENIN